MEIMAWTDTSVCSFCGKEIPIHRRLSKAQFCSKAHEESFHQQQNQMAVESLHRTHDALKAYRPSGASIEDILGSPAPRAAQWAPVAVAEPVVEHVIDEPEQVETATPTVNRLEEFLPEETVEWDQAAVELPEKLLYADSYDAPEEAPAVEVMDQSVFHFGDSQAMLQESGFLASLRRLWESLTSRRA